MADLRLKSEMVKRAVSNANRAEGSAGMAEGQEVSAVIVGCGMW